MHIVSALAFDAKRSAVQTNTAKISPNLSNPRQKNSQPSQRLSMHGSRVASVVYFCSGLLVVWIKRTGPWEKVDISCMKVKSSFQIQILPTAKHSQFRLEESTRTLKKTKGYTSRILKSQLQRTESCLWRTSLLMARSVVISSWNLRAPKVGWHLSWCFPLQIQVLTV